jgi:hypothetical protein
MTEKKQQKQEATQEIRDRVRDLEVKKLELIFTELRNGALTKAQIQVLKEVETELEAIFKSYFNVKRVLHSSALFYTSFLGYGAKA